MARRSEERIRARIAQNLDTIHYYQTTNFVYNDEKAVAERQAIIDHRIAENTTLLWVLKED